MSDNLALLQENVDSIFTILSNDINIGLTKISYEKNPIHISSIIETQNQSVGYLMFNRFIGDYNDELIIQIHNVKAAEKTEAKEIKNKIFSTLGFYFPENFQIRYMSKIKSKI